MFDEWYEDGDTGEGVRRGASTTMGETGDMGEERSLNAVVSNGDSDEKMEYVGDVNSLGGVGSAGHSGV